MDIAKFAPATAAFGATVLLGTTVVHFFLKGKEFKEFQTHHAIILTSLGLGLGYLVYINTPDTPIITTTTAPK